MSDQNLTKQMMAMQPLPSQGSAPEWVHLLPTRSGRVFTRDRRGPYVIQDAEAIIAASFADADKLELDVNHATDIAAPQGREAPAVGWITEMEARDDGIWGKVDWNASGRALVEDRAYRGISPVILHDKARVIRGIRRASLINRPNLRGLTALHQESEMTLLERLAELLGLDAASSESQIISAVQAMQEDTGGDAAALQSQISEIGSALGLGQGGDANAVLEAARKAASGAAGESETIAALQSELNEVAGQLNDMRETQSRTAAETFVDNAIRDLRVGVKNQRDRFISMHMKDPEGTKELVNGFQKVGPSGTLITPPKSEDGTVALNAEQEAVAGHLGFSTAEFAELVAKDEQKEAL